MKSVMMPDWFLFVIVWLIFGMFGLLAYAIVSGEYTIKTRLLIIMYNIQNQRV